MNITYKGKKKERKKKSHTARNPTHQFNADYNRKANSCGQCDQLIHPWAELWFGHLLRALSVQIIKKDQRTEAACSLNNCSGAQSLTDPLNSTVYMCGAIRWIIVSPHKEAVRRYRHTGVLNYNCVLLLFYPSSALPNRHSTRAWRKHMDFNNLQRTNNLKLDTMLTKSGFLMGCVYYHEANKVLLLIIRYISEV